MVLQEIILILGDYEKVLRAKVSASDFKMVQQKTCVCVCIC